MALDNLISFELTAQEETDINSALTIISTILGPKVINLTPDERSHYGRIGNRTENWIDKIKDYMDRKPNLIPNFLNKAEHDKDHAARQTLQSILSSLAQLYESVDDTQKLISTDLYQNSLVFYRNLKLASQQNVPGSTVIFDDLQAQFPQRAKRGPKGGGIGHEPPSTDPK